MSRIHTARRTRNALLSTAAAVVLFVAGAAGRASAADHGDSPTVAHDQAADIADVFIFLDPADNSRAVVAATFRGFIVPGEAVNFGIFDPALRYRFEIENTGDAKPDQFIDVQFDQRINTATPQTATVRLPYGGRRGRGKTFEAPATNPSLNPTPNEPTVTTDSETGVQFFAGEVDDPFFFDIPAFSRFIASVRAGSPDATQFNRGRDSFAGYNCLSIVFSIPVALLKGEDGGDVIGVHFRTQRRSESLTKDGEVRSRGSYRNVDRMGNPAVNVALVPFELKNRHNGADTRIDAKGEFAEEIVGTLTTLGTSEANINVLAGIVVTNGDFVRVNTTIPNTGPGGGNNPEAAFPNGRRFGDDTIDILLNVISNGGGLSDSVDANDVPLRDTFPYVAPPQQPREPGVIDENTRY